KGVTEANWQDAGKKDPNFLESESPLFVGRAVAALAADPNVLARSGQLLSSWELARHYQFTDDDGRRPDWGKLAIDFSVLPPPLASKVNDAYRKTWDLFFSWSNDPVIFAFNEMQITAGADVAFVAALMRCAGTEKNGERIELEFRLTIGLRKIGGKWTVTH